MIDVAALTKALKEEIKNYDSKGDKEDIGSVLTVGDGVANIYGLDKVMAGELVEFENGGMGLVLNLEEKSVGVIVLTKEESIKEGSKVKRTKRVLEVKMGDSLIGRVVDALGNPIDNKGEIKGNEYYPVEKIAPLVMERIGVNTPLETGIKAIDSLTPIGRGQRELIIGDRQTGKSTIAIDTIINQKGKDVICIYVCIGQKNSTVAQMVDKFEKCGAMEYTIVVNASASESASMQYIAPYAGCAMGEYFMDKGKDVLIVYDDLSKHAVSYRTLSLLLKRPPGREAYPGDVFYLHSRLLERSANLAKGGSLTALPIIETQEGDISAYIPTNVISITDGQIFLQTDLFNAGVRPAIDSGLSVSRVGSKAQSKAMKHVADGLKIEIANYKELESFARFGSDLDKTTLETLQSGEKTIELLKQDAHVSYSLAMQVIVLFGIKHKLLSSIKVDKIRKFEKYLLEKFNSKHSKIMEEINIKQIVDEKLGVSLTKLISEYVNEFNKLNED